MAAAYKYSIKPDGSQPKELILLHYIDRFGVKAVMGRDTLGVGEMKRMMLVENIVNAHPPGIESGEWKAWAEQNPQLSHILIGAMRQVSKDGRSPS